MVKPPIDLRDHLKRFGNHPLPHTAESFQLHGIRLFHEHAVDYVHGNCYPPIVRAPSLNAECVHITFSNGLLYRFATDPLSLEKAYEVSVKYGFRGYSRGGNNGIFLLRKGDGLLIDSLRNLMARMSD